MDPDKTLKEIRELLRKGYSCPESEAHYVRFNALRKFDDLDRWLSTGGFLPKEWQR